MRQIKTSCQVLTRFLAGKGAAVLASRREALKDFLSMREVKRIVIRAGGEKQNAEQVFQGCLFTGDGKVLTGTSKMAEREAGFYAVRTED